MENTTIAILNSEEIENKYNKDNIKIDAALMAHRKKISYIIDALTMEKKRIDAEILDSVNHEKVKNSLFYTIISDFMDFNKDTMIEKYGEQAYNDCKTKPVHREQVRTK